MSHPGVGEPWLEAGGSLVGLECARGARRNRHDAHKRGQIQAYPAGLHQAAGLLSLEDRRPRQFQGILGALDREACQVLLSEGTEFDKALLPGWLTGALWTAARAHARGLRATPLCPYCSRQQAEDNEHILWACPAWGIHRSGAWRSLMRTGRALGLSDQISSWPTC